MRLRLAGIRRAVIVAPHPDDEVIGAAALIRALRRQGSQVAVIVVSDGAASHPNSVTWPAKRLTAARERESLHALRRLGVRRGAVTFLRLPDGGLSDGQDRCRIALHQTLGGMGSRTCWSDLRRPTRIPTTGPSPMRCDVFVSAGVA